MTYACRRRRWGGGVGALALLLVLSGCSVNPATGKRQFNLIGEAREIDLGTQAAPGFVDQNGGEVPSEPLKQYVSDLGLRLAAVSERPHLPWKFHVLNTDQINAFALPGGKVFMTRGLLSRMTNEAQLAGVLGHEIGHVTGQHVNGRMSQAILVQGVAIGAGAAGEATDEDWLKVLGAGVSVGGGVYLLKFSRDQESESDMLGVRYMSKLGYNPLGQVEVMEILKAASGGGGGSEFFATHPLPATRIKRLQKLIEQQYPQASTPGTYRFGEASFDRHVVQELKRLPPTPAPPKQEDAALAPYTPAGACASCRPA